MKYIDLSKKKQSKIIKHLKRWKLYTALLIIVSIFVYIIVLGTIQFSKQLFSLKAYAPTHKVYAIAETTPTPVPTEKEEIVAYVKEVFGEDADKAFKVLSCENHALNPKAVNGAGNEPAGSLDLGLFQINNHWQKIENKAFLFDFKVNTQIAYNIFSRDGHSFKLWTCGRKLGL